MHRWSAGWLAVASFFCYPTILIHSSSIHEGVASGAASRLGPPSPRKKHLWSTRLLPTAASGASINSSEEHNNYGVQKHIKIEYSCPHLAHRLTQLYALLNSPCIQVPGCTMPRHRHRAFLSLLMPHRHQTPADEASASCDEDPLPP